MKKNKQGVRVYTVSGLGRDLAYTLYSTYLMVFFTDALGLTEWELIAVGVVMSIARIWDAINDPLMGIIIDNRTTKWGKFKPWILVGAITSAICFFLLFQDFGLTGWAFVIVFAIIYVLSDMTYTMNDIAYWTMYSTFSTDAKEREKIGSQARTFASIGMFITVALTPIIYQSGAFGTPKKAFSLWSLIIVSIFLISQIMIVLFVRESKDPIMTQPKTEKTKFKDILKIIFKNDQLVVLMFIILFLNIGYFITTALGIYFFNYDFNKYGGFEFTIFSVILAVSQLLAFILLPILTKNIRENSIHFSLWVNGCRICFVFLVGYVLPMNMIFIGIAGFLLFFGQGFMQVLHIIMLADTIEYGQWKLGTRNESVIFSVNPFVVKLATSIQILVVSITLAINKLNRDVIKPLTDEINLNNPGNDWIRNFIGTNVTSEMRLGLRMSMLLIPFLFVLASYLLYRFKFKIDEDMHQKITEEIRQRVEIESIDVKFYNTL